MSDKPAASEGRKPKPDRDQRLKAALKANMARRKAQARARADGDGQTADGPGDEN
ncbi:MAG: hypothetical protein KDK10_05625 [Maritimibacter sp.]|nr:hypothetical protein [Maritimibacter sp.]